MHPIQVSQWKKQLLESESDLFSPSKKSKDKDDSQAKESELFQQIGILQIELEPPLPGKLTPLHPDHFHHQGA